MGERNWNNRESRDWNGKDSGAGWNTAADEKAIGTIDDYELLRELGTGGFGSVYLARDKVSRTFVAVKGLPQQVNDSAGELERIRANFALVSKLKHPNVAAVLALRRVDVISCGDSEVLRKLNVKGGDTLLVMDYAPGVTLDSWCRQFPDRKVPVDQAIEVTRQIAAALDAAHKLKIVHRDVKPQNVMVETLSDGTFTARVLDFGLAAEVRSSVNRVSKEERKDSSGTLQYMAPEQLEGHRASAAMDQYALAALFYELVTGDVPFSSVFECGDKGIIINVVTTKPPEIPEELPRPVRKALARALAKQPQERFASCGDFVAALQGAVRVRRGLVAGILAAVAVAGAGAWWLGRPEPPVSAEPNKPSAVQPAPAVHVAAPPASVPVTRPAPVPSVDVEAERRRQELAAETAVFALSVEMENASQRIAGESEDVRAFFASEIHAFENVRKTGNDAKANKSYVTATNFFVQAKAQADALRKLVDARKDKVKAITGEFNRLCDAKEWDKAHKLAQDADKTDSTVQNKLGVMYANGWGVAKDDAQAVEWYRKAAEQGYAKAQFNLGVMYADGCGVAKDDAQAVKWFRKAAEQGDADAQYKLGVMYANGRGVAKDDAQEVEWYRKAAEQGYAKAQFNLGVMYANGRGVAKDDAQAVEWYRKAAGRGFEAAKKVLQRLGK